MSEKEMRPLALVDPLVEAAHWRMLGLLLERPRARWREELSAMGDESPEPELRGLAEEACRATESAYLHVLGPGGLVSPREAAYGTSADPGRLLAELRSLYDAFRYRPRAEDPPDHAGIEAGFAGYLFLKLAFARECGDLVAAASTSRALEVFLAAHLGAFASELAGRLERAPLPYLAEAAALTTRRIAMYGIRPEPLTALPIFQPGTLEPQETGANP